MRLVLSELTAFSSFETSVDATGDFGFSKIPQGTYVPSLIAAGFPGLLSPMSVVVSGTDLISVEFTVPKPSTVTARPPVDDDPVGVVITNLGGNRQQASEAAAVANLRTINTALVTYLSANQGRYGNLTDLINAGLIDARFTGTVSGLNFSIIAAGSNYAAVAVPAAQGNTRYGYYSTPDGVIRYVTLESLAPPREGGNPVQ